MKIPKLQLPSGGWVEFHDPLELRSDAYRAVRGQMTGATTTAGERMGSVYQVAARELISAWSVPYLGEQLMPPKAVPDLLEQLKLNDTKALDKHLQPVITKVFLLDEPVEPDWEYGDPLLPVGGSGQSSKATAAPDHPTAPASSDSPTPSGMTDGSSATPDGASGR